MIFLLILLFASLNTQSIDAGNCLKCQHGFDRNDDVPQHQNVEEVFSGAQQQQNLEEMHSSDDTEERQEKDDKRREIFSEQEYLRAEEEFYRSHPAQFRGQYADPFAGQEIDEAGPSLVLPEKVQAPDEKTARKYINEVIKVINKAMKGNNDPIDFLLEIKEGILNTIETRLANYSDDAFLKVIKNKMYKYCGDLVRKKSTGELSQRALTYLFELDEEREIISRRFSSGHEQQTRQTGITGKLIAEEKKNGRTFCRVGVYLAMCQMIKRKYLNEEKDKLLLSFIKLWKDAAKQLKDETSGLVNSDKIRANIQHLTFRSLIRQMKLIIYY